MQYLFKTFIVIFLFAPLNAQQDPQAGAILDKVAEINKSYQSIKAEFKLTVIDLQQDSKDIYNGKIAMKDGMFKLELIDNITYYDRETVWTYMPDVKEVNINAAENVDISSSFLTNPAKLFELYKENYKYKLAGEKNIDDEIQYLIDLVPGDENSEYSLIKLLISKDKMILRSATLMGKDGIHYVFEIASQVNDSKMTDSYFRFNPSEHPDVEVIDLR